MILNKPAPIDPRIVKPQDELLSWIRMIPETTLISRPLGARLPQFFQTARASVLGGAVDLRQRVILKLASEGGLTRIKELTDTEVTELPYHKWVSFFLESVSPFFEAISHPDILSSCILENYVDTIYNFLFGPSGRRAIKVFGFVSLLFPSIVSNSTDNSDLGHVEASIAVLQKLVDLNGTAMILDEFRSIAQNISDCLSGDFARIEELPVHRTLHNLTKIQRRLDLGSAISPLQVTQNKEAVPAATYQVRQDLPGALSVYGPRHDNDHEDISEIKILPTALEIQSYRSEYLPIRDPAAWHLPGIRGLLDRQFRLLREDTIGQLRDAVGLELKRLQTQGDQRKPKPNAANPRQGPRTIVYDHVQIVDFEFDKLKGLQVLAEFYQPPALAKMTVAQRKEWWKNSRQLQMDSLLCLVDSQGWAVFMTVAGPPDTSPAAKRGHNDTPAVTAPSNLFHDPHFAIAHLRLADPSSSDTIRLFHLFADQASRRLCLVEFPGVLLPAFRPTLEVLQRLHQSEELPFADYLAPVATSTGKIYIPPPHYALQSGFQFDLSCLVQGREPLTFNPRRRHLDLKALLEGSTLDHAQGKALLGALSRRLALVQGPPGTGKSFTGISLIKVLLNNRGKARLGPIICVCYTNHALDQLLEHLVKDGVEGIVRIGSRSKSELLEPLNLRRISQKVDKTKTERHQEWETHDELKRNNSDIEGLLGELERSGSASSLKNYLRTYHPHHYDELFGTDEDGFQVVHHSVDDVIPSWLHCKGAYHGPLEGPLRPLSTLLDAGLQGMQQEERWILHENWQTDLTNIVCESLQSALKLYNKTRNDLHKCREELDLRCLQDARVIGVTTTGLARQINVLRRLSSKVMICEEAGEVLEAHTITALLPHIEHAILIGDHQQLRPQIQSYDLQLESPSGEQYSLDVSLFERLVKPNEDWGLKIPYDTLEIQRRMHPSIAQLVRDTLYPKLQNHPSMHEYSEVFGLGRRLFWLDHREPEAASDPSQALSTSKSNEFEVEMTAALVSHLVRQSRYQSDDIAVITPYLGQLRKLRNRMSQSFEIVLGDRDVEDLEKEGLEDQVSTGEKQNRSGLRKTSLQKALRLATVDNFQGEEAKVVVISLVRSNPNRNCGFLRTSNRINVLLSRAQHGMYIIGNAQTSSHVPMWAEVLSILQAGGNIGTSLALRCQRHPETSIEVSTPDSFSRLAPEGGCDKRCGLRLQCGHSCVNRCHSQPIHDAVVCIEPCRRSKAGCDHSCLRFCGQKCEEKCHVQVSNVGLPCGHVQGELDCYLAQDTSQVICHKPVERDAPWCGHAVKVDCYVDVAADGFECNASCGALLPCGHACLRPCNECHERGENEGNWHGTCQNLCGRPYNNCAHQCQSVCHGSEPCPLCSAPCEVRCAHSQCNKTCQEPCAPCAEKCQWSCPHRGQCQMPCAVPCDVLPCSERCRELLFCGHQCPSICGEACPSSHYCQICAPETVKNLVVDYIMQTAYSDVDLDDDPVIVPTCGHILALSSMDGTMSMSSYYELSEEGVITALKPLPIMSAAERLKSCPLCRGPLRNVNRYSRIVRQGLIEQATQKFIAWANRQYLPLAKRLDEEEEKLQQNTKASDVLQGAERGLKVGIPTINLTYTTSHQTSAIRKFSALKSRYKSVIALRKEVSQLLAQVSEEEQPIGRVFDMVQDVRRRRGVTVSLKMDPTALNTRNRILVTLLTIRCDLVMISDFIMLRRESRNSPDEPHGWALAELHADFSQNRQTCESLATECLARDQPGHEVEARVHSTMWSILESSTHANPAKAEQRRAHAEEQLAEAAKICERNPGQTRSVWPDVERACNMLSDLTFFYAEVDNAEKHAIYAAMAAEFSGTGHWYTCANSHLFTVGECGLPMESARCPQCDAPVGGQGHETAAGVTRASNFEEEFGRLQV